MSGIVGSYHNIRGSGVVAKLGTDGQVFTSTGAGLTQGFEDAAGGGAWTLIKTLTSDGSDATMDFVDGTDDVVLDSTYKQYLFTWMDIHPEDNSVYFEFQANAAGGSGFNETITSTAFRAYHDESDSSTHLGYYAGGADLAQQTIFQRVCITVNNAADNSTCGTLRLFNPSSTTFVKHFTVQSQTIIDDDEANQVYVGGYINTTSAIDEIQWKWSAGEIQAGTISLYGLTI